MFHPVKLSLPVTVLWFLAESVSGQCAIPGNTFFPSPDALSCFNSIPFSPEVRDSTVEMLQKSMELFVFLDISRDSPEPLLPVHVDLIEELEALKSVDFGTDWEFHSYLAHELFSRLMDTHTRVRVPQCYLDVSFYQPLQLVAWVDESSNEPRHLVSVSEYMPEDLFEYYTNTLRIPLQSFYNAEVLSINHIPVLEVISEYAQRSVGMTKDMNARFNVALTRFTPKSDGWRAQAGYWQFRSMERSPAPTQSSEIFTLRLANGEQIDVEIPWVARSTRAYTSVQDFMSRYWTTKDYKPDPPLPGWEDEMVFRRQGPKKTKTFANADLLLTSNNAELWRLSSETAVLTVDTFSPSSQTEFVTEVSRMLGLAHEMSLNKLIIDLTNNGGGSICLGRNLHDALFPNQPGDHITDIPDSELAQHFVRNSVALNQNGFWRGSNWLGYNDVRYSGNNTDFMDFGPTFVRGGRARRYSQPIRIQCNQNINANGYSPDKIILLSHGFCGSTCSIFTTHMMTHDNVMSIAVAGIPGTPMQYQGFPGGQVYEHTVVWNTINNLQVDTNDPAVPRRGFTTANFRFACREMYSPYIYSIHPAEFVFHPADVHIDNNEITASNPEAVWDDVEFYFNDGAWEEVRASRAFEKSFVRDLK